MFATLASLIAPFFVNFTMQFVLRISTGVLTAATFFLEWTMSENFIRISYSQMTGPYANPIIGIGWPLLRDLVNMGFLVMIIFIGIATSLRIQEYQAQKTLVPLIFIAILINFTPVIIGTIVDASNILMNFFLDGISGIKVWQSHVAAQGSIIGNIIEAITNPLTNPEAAMKAIISTFFNFISATMIMIFAFLFLVRHIAIWILVILSPLAFASYIFPTTRSLFTTWWRQLMQWCFVGVTAGFFLYLANQLILKSADLKISSPPSKGTVESFIATLVPYIISTAFLLFGLMTGFSTSAIGASAVISFTKKNANRLRKFSQAKTVSALRGIPFVSNLEGRYMRSLEGIPLLGNALGGRGAYTKRLQGRASASMQKIEQIALDPGGDKIIEDMSKSAGVSGDKVAAIQYRAKEGNLSSSQTMRDDVKKLKKLGHDMSAVYDVHPEWSNDDSKVSKADELRYAGMGIPKGKMLNQKKFEDNRDQMKHLDGAKVLNLDKEAFKDQGVVAGMTARQASQLISAGAMEEMNQITETICKMTGYTGGKVLAKMVSGIVTPPRTTLPSGGTTSNVSNDLINHIVTQQSAGKWPV